MVLNFKFCVSGDLAFLLLKKLELVQTGLIWFQHIRSELITTNCGQVDVSNMGNGVELKKTC